MVNSRNLYVLSPVIENGEALSYYCLVSLAHADCNWMLMRDDELLCHGVCDRNDVGLMLDSLCTDLSLSGGNQEWETATIQ
jgi:hypothetical protein